MIIRDGEITIGTIERSVTKVPLPELGAAPLDLDDDVNLAAHFSLAENLKLSPCTETKNREHTRGMLKTYY